MPVSTSPPKDKKSAIEILKIKDIKSWNSFLTLIVVQLRAV